MSSPRPDLARRATAEGLATFASALAEAKKVKAKVTVRATDAAGNVATAKRTIRVVKGPQMGAQSFGSSDSR